MILAGTKIYLLFLTPRHSVTTVTSEYTSHRTRTSFIFTLEMHCHSDKYEGKLFQIFLLQDACVHNSSQQVKF